jgi:maleate isomerase
VRKASAETAALVLRNKGRFGPADAIFISCTNLKSLDQIARLEAELDMPVVSSNSATLWLGLQAINAPIAHLPLGALYKCAPAWTACAREDVALAAT